MRVIGLDLGTRTCGIALSDPMGIIASGYDELIELVKEQKYEERAFKSDSIEQIIQKLPSIFSKDEIRNQIPNASLSTINRVLVKLREEGRIKPLGTGRSAKWIKIEEKNDLKSIFGAKYDV